MMSAAEVQSIAADSTARVLAFYLPQFHPIPENDAWWGQGFTEWTSVRRARPLFAGHDQPACPTTLGYYDLRDVDTHLEQAELARAYGVGGFCYYAYWFEGRRLLEEPLDVVAKHSDLNMPYAICWANEPWSRRWDGSENEVLVSQRHSAERDPDFISSVAHHLADARYIRVEGRPLVLVYRPSLLVDPLRTTDALRKRCVELGLPDPYLATVQSFDHWEPISYGFDAAVEFPPHKLFHPTTKGHQSQLDTKAHPRLISYEDAIRSSVGRPVPDFTWFRAAMPAWDNTPRRGTAGVVFTGSTPELFRQWLVKVLEYTYLFNAPSRRLVFINAWNEWAEGAYLEPDVSTGHARLQALRDALTLTADLAHQSTMAWSSALLQLARDRWLSRP